MSTKTSPRRPRIVPSWSKRHLEVAFGLARMSDRHEVLAPVLDPFDRMVEFARGEGDQEILGIELAARAEAAANVVFDIVDRPSGRFIIAAKARRLKNGSFAAP